MSMKKYFPAMAILLLTALMWAGFHGRGQQVWENIQDTRLTFETGLERTGADYGVMNGGPGLSVTGGRYAVYYDIESDGENVLRVSAKNGADISPAAFAIPAGHAQGHVEFYSLDELYDLTLQVDYTSGSFIRVNRIDLTGNANTDGLWTLTFMLLAAAVLFALRACGWLTGKRMGELAIIAMAVLIASLPDLRGNLHLGHDSEFHMGRLLNLVHGLRGGQFPLRVGTYLQNGYGAVTSVYYPELFMYIPAGMMLIGGSFTYCYHAFFMLMHLTGALTMRYAAEKVFSSGRAGVTAAVLYTLSQYRLMNIYSRFAVGESLAMCFLPLFLLGLYELILGDKRRWRLLAFSATAICQSHLISTAVCGVVALGAGVLGIVKIIKEGRLLPIMKAMAAAALLNLFFLVPLMDFGQQDIATSWMMRDLNQEAVHPAQLLMTASNATGLADSGLSGYAVGIGTPLLIAAAAALYAAFSHEKKEKEDLLALLLCAAGVVCAVMSTRLFPWGRVTSLTGGLAAYIQFPWRMLVLTSACFALAGGYAASRMTKEDGAAGVAVLALCAVCMLPLLTQEARDEKFIKKGWLPEWDVRFGDYTLPGANLRLLDETGPVADDGVTITEFEKIGTEITAQVSAPEGGSVMMPLYAFLGYEASVDGKRAGISASENSHMVVTLEPGTEGQLTVTYAGKALWRACDAASLAALLALIVSAVKKKKRA